MRKRIIELLIWALRKAFNHPESKQQITPFIKEMYRSIARENLDLKAEVLNVKKGKRRYDLLLFETPKGNLRFNLGRHWETK